MLYDRLEGARARLHEWFWVSAENVLAECRNPWKKMVFEKSLVLMDDNGSYLLMAGFVGNVGSRQQIAHKLELKANEIIGLFYCSISLDPKLIIVCAHLIGVVIPQSPCTRAVHRLIGRRDELLWPNEHPGKFTSIL